jgi:hypothetical protein
MKSVLHFYRDSTEKRNGMLTKHLIPLTLFVILVCGCSESPSTNIDAEPALAVLGGAVLGTQSLGKTAFNTPKRTPAVERMLNALNPITEAFAAATVCPDMTGGSCVGSVLSVNMDNCLPSGPVRAGYWKSIISYNFPTATDCTNALAGGFNATTIAGLVGNSFTRAWGQTASGEQNNIRLAQDGLVTYFYSDYPTGWQEDRMGAVTVTYETSTRRRMVVGGVHAFGVYNMAGTTISDPSSFDLTTLPSGHVAGAPADKTIITRWDHTIHTVKTGDQMFGIGPNISFSGGSVTYGSFGTDTKATFDGDIVVEGNTVAAGATLRVQHNISASIGVLSVVEPLVYGDSNCCWPTQGTVQVEYDRNLKAPTLQETVVFQSTCGAIEYTTSSLTKASKTLSHCF